MTEPIKPGEIWDQTRRFVAREGALAFPLGFATFGLSVLLASLVVPADPELARRPGPWLVHLLPALGLSVVGYLAVSALVLRPGSSVLECLVRAMRRLPDALLGVLLVLLGLLGALVAAALLGVIIGIIARLPTSATEALSLILSIPALVWISIRLIMFWAVAVDSDRNGIEILRAAFRASRGNFSAIAGFLLAGTAAYMLIVLAVQIAGGSLVILVGKLLGQEAAGQILAAVLVAGAAGVCSVYWNVFVAFMYLRLRPA